MNELLNLKLITEKRFYILKRKNKQILLKDYRFSEK